MLSAAFVSTSWSRAQMSSFCHRQQPEAKTSSRTNQGGNCFKGKKREKEEQGTREEERERENIREQ